MFSTLTLQLTLSLSLSVPAAPAPLPRPVLTIDRMDLVGVYELTWGDSKWVMELRHDGPYNVYCMESGKRLWWGRWRWEDSKLKVWEIPWNTNGPAFEVVKGYPWEMEIRRNRNGTPMSVTQLKSMRKIK